MWLANQRQGNNQLQTSQIMLFYSNWLLSYNCKKCEKIISVLFPYLVSDVSNNPFWSMMLNHYSFTIQNSEHYGSKRLAISYDIFCIINKSHSPWLMICRHLNRHVKNTGLWFVRGHPTWALIGWKLSSSSSFIPVGSVRELCSETENL